MGKTWEELQITCLQKLFASTETTLVRDDSTLPYLSAMPAAANEAMHILVTVGRYFQKAVRIVQGGDNPTLPNDIYTRENAYDMHSLAGDFYSFDRCDIYFDDGYVYGITTDYGIENACILLLDKDKVGEWKVWYNAYPPKITEDTEDDFVIDLPGEVIEMVALYMAGQIYKEEETALAQIYMNEFDAWLSELKESAKRAKKYGSGGRFTSTKGWF